MDRKQLITGFAVAVAVVGLYFGLAVLKRVEPRALRCSYRAARIRHNRPSRAHAARHRRRRSPAWHPCRPRRHDRPDHHLAPPQPREAAISAVPATSARRAVILGRMVAGRSE